MTLQYAVAAGTAVATAAKSARRVLLLTTIGQRSGHLRTTVLPYYRVGDDLVVCGTNGGGPHDPGWAHNVRADGRVWFRRGGGRLVPARAHVAEGDDRERLFAEVAPRHGGLERYQRQASRHGRDVPLVVIRPGE